MRLRIGNATAVILALDDARKWPRTCIVKEELTHVTVDMPVNELRAALAEAEAKVGHGWRPDLQKGTQVAMRAFVRIGQAALATEEA